MTKKDRDKNRNLRKRNRARRKMVLYGFRAFEAFQQYQALGDGSSSMLGDLLSSLGGMNNLVPKKKNTTARRIEPSSPSEGMEN